jgi:hypothetical protein
VKAGKNTNHPHKTIKVVSSEMKNDVVFLGYVFEQWGSSVETYDSLLVFSSKVLDLGLEQEVIDVKGDVGNGEDEDLDGEQEDLLRDELCRL